VVIDISLYDASKSLILNLFESSNRDIKRTISMMGSSTGVPCIVIAYWLGEYTQWHPDTLAAIKRLTDFYDYSEILNKPEGSPI